jgi:predicted component of type VI protein secretion system
VSTRPLVVRVEEVATGAAWFYRFDSGPVWIGCNPSASLSIARPFILEQHGIIQFDERSVRYQDLDASSATLIDGEPAGTGETPLTEWSRVEMGPVRLTVSRRPPEEPISDPAASPFAARAASTLVLPQRPDLPLANTAPPPDWSPPLPRAAPSTVTDRLARSDELDEALALERSGGRENRRPTETRKKPTRRRRVKSRFSFLAWLSAFALFVGIVGVAGLILQHRGLPWMPPALAARIPPWLAALFQ